MLPVLQTSDVSHAQEAAIYGLRELFPATDRPQAIDNIKVGSIWMFGIVHSALSRALISPGAG